jgi:DNA recombination protein RmuC
MDIAVALALMLAAAALTIAILILRRGNRQPAADAVPAAEMAMLAQKLAESQGQLAGRLDQMASQQAAQQAKLADSLQTQERALAKALDERLGAFNQKVQDALGKSATDTTNTLGDLRERLAVIDSAQKTITQLSSQVVALQDILSNKQARGAFGEIQLENLVRAALPPDAYRFQSAIGSGRVDCLLQLPKPPGPIAIDAKFPLESYQALIGATDETAKLAARKALGQAVLLHVRAIRDKYIVPGETAESALMFLPSEAIYAELHANLREVIEQSYRERVWIVSPTTLMATLNTVRAVLRDAAMREQAHLIQQEVVLLLEDVERLDERVGKLQTHFGQTSEDIRQIRISADKVKRRAGRIEEVELEDEEPPAALPARSEP